MVTRVRPAVLGVAILGVAALGAYVWPVSTDHGCSPATSTRERYECLQEKLEAASRPWPAPLNYVQAIFLTNDLKALDSATTAAFLAQRQAEESN